MSDAEPNEQSSEDSEQSEEKPADSEQSVEESDASDQSTEQSDEQSSDSDQAVDQSAEQSASETDQPAEQSEEQVAESNEPSEQVEEQPADSDQPAASATADNTLAFAGAASPGGGGTGVQARLGSQPKRPPRAPVKHDFAVRFTFGTTEPGLLAKGLYLFEIRADDGSRLAARAWSSVSVTVPDFFNFSLSQITRSGEKNPSFDFQVDLRWLPFSTSSGTPADPNDSDNADKIRKDFRIITTLRPKDDKFGEYLTIPPPKGTAVTKIDLHSSIGIVDSAVSAPSTNENDFIAALFSKGVDMDMLVEKGSPQQYTKGGVTEFLYEVKYYGGASIKGATVLP